MHNPPVLTQQKYSAAAVFKGSEWHRRILPQKAVRAEPEAGLTITPRNHPPSSRCPCWWGSRRVAATVHGLHAQAQPPGYAVIELDVQQPEEFEKEFVPLATKAVTDQHGKFLAKFGPTTTIEGNPPKWAAVIEFESVDRAVATFGSAAYRNALKIGDRYARFQIFAVQGASQQERDRD
jgi:uncharacterized protein (DUF1330 family)